MKAVTREMLPPIELQRPAAEEVDALIAAVLARIDRTLPQFIDHFPAPASESGVYAPIDNVEWTNGFWTGMLWLAWELTGRPIYRETAERHVLSFADRIERGINVDRRDVGVAEPCCEQRGVVARASSDLEDAVTVSHAEGFEHHRGQGRHRQ